MQSGKTHISNYLSGATEISGEEYKPTQGVRILEFESSGENSEAGSSFKAEVELWDCSGDSRYNNSFLTLIHRVNEAGFTKVRLLC